MSLYRIEFTNDSEFAYASGRVKTLETYMIPKNEFDRMADSTVAQIEKTLSEYGYAENDPDFIKNNREAAYSTVAGLVKSVNKYKDFYKIYFLKNDIENMKVVLKTKLLEEKGFTPDYMPALVSGILNDKKINDIIEEKSYRYISRDTGDLKLLTNYFELINEKKSPVWIDFYLDSIYLDLLIKYVNKMNLKFLQYYFSHYIDFMNIENLLRFKILDKNINMYKEIFVSGGSLKWLDLKDLFDEKIEKIADRLYHKEYYEYISRGLEDFSNTNNFNKFELEKDNYLISVMKKAKLRAFGIEPVIGYLEGKEIEYKNIRILLEGKNAKISDSKIKEMLRDTYV